MRYYNNYLMHKSSDGLWEKHKYVGKVDRGGGKAPLYFYDQAKYYAYLHGSKSQRQQIQSAMDTERNQRRNAEKEEARQNSRTVTSRPTTTATGSSGTSTSTTTATGSSGTSSKSFGDTIKSNVDTAVNAVTKNVNTLLTTQWTPQSFMEALGSNISTAWNAVSRNASTVINQGMQAVNGWISDAGKTLSNIGKDIANTGKRLLTNIDHAIGISDYNTLNSTSASNREKEDAGNRYNNSLMGRAQQLGNNIGNAVSSAWNTVSNIPGQIADWAGVDERQRLVDAASNTEANRYSANQGVYQQMATALAKENQLRSKANDTSVDPATAARYREQADAYHNQFQQLNNLYNGSVRANGDIAYNEARDAYGNTLLGRAENVWNNVANTFGFGRTDADINPYVGQSSRQTLAGGTPETNNVDNMFSVTNGGTQGYTNQNGNVNYGGTGDYSGTYNYAYAQYLREHPNGTAQAAENFANAAVLNAMYGS